MCRHPRIQPTGYGTLKVMCGSWVPPEGNEASPETLRHNPTNCKFCLPMRGNATGVFFLAQKHSTVDHYSLIDRPIWHQNSGKKGQKSNGEIRVATTKSVTTSRESCCPTSTFMTVQEWQDTACLINLAVTAPYILLRLQGLIALRPVADRGLAVPTRIGATRAYDTLVHGGLDAVVLLDVQLGQGVVVEYRSLADVTKRRRIHNVPVHKWDFSMTITPVKKCPNR